MQHLIEKTTIFELINAGHLARQAMLSPLFKLGLKLGDDAILFGLNDSGNTSENDLCQMTGLGIVALKLRLDRIEKLGLIDRIADDNGLISSAILSQKGQEVCDILAANWKQLDEALIGELTKAKKENLQKTLERFIKLLSL